MGPTRLDCSPKPSSPYTLPVYPGPLTLFLPSFKPAFPHHRR